MSLDDLDAPIHQALRALPPPRAPARLLPRVLAAAQQPHVRPWYERGWFAWPRAWQIAAIGALVLVASASVLMLPSAFWPLAETVREVSHASARVSAASVEYVKVASDTGLTLVRVLQPLLALLALVVALMLVACAVFGTALNHVLLGRTSEP